MRVLFILGGVLSLTNFALAADFPSGPPPALPPVYAPAYIPLPPPPPYNWNSVYIGGNAGFGIADASATATDGGLSLTESATLTGFVGGMQLGGNYQTGMFVVGLEGDFEGSTQSYTTTVGTLTSTDKVVYLGTVRGRVGAAFNRVLVYTTVGGGYGEFQNTTSITGFGTLTSSESHAFWVVGTGVEVGLTDILSARVEYLFSRYRRYCLCGRRGGCHRQPTRQHRACRAEFKASVLKYLFSARLGERGKGLGEHQKFNIW